MCFFAPKVPKPPVPAQFQAMQQPRELMNPKGNRSRLRGLYASLFTAGGAQGIAGKPVVTGTTGGMTGG